MATIINTLEVVVESPKPVGTAPPVPEPASSPMLLEDVHDRRAWLRLRLYAH
jgi:hypothetical protein